MAKTKTQKKNYQAWSEGRRKLEDNNLFSKYSNRFKRKKQVDGEWVDWDIRTDAPWNSEAAWSTIYQNVYGTETPWEDYKYLQAKEIFDNEQSRIKGNDALSNLRRQFSPKTVNEGERQIDIKREEDRLKKESELAQLRQNSSFRIDHESVEGWEGGVFEPTDETESLSDQALSRDEEVGENPNYFQKLGGVDQGYWMNGQWVSNMTDTDRSSLEKINKARNNYYTEVNAAREAKVLEQAGGQEYVTDYQTAIRNSRRDGLSFGEAEQYYGEDVLDSAGRRVRKSNVFTEDEDGNPMGVKTRRQRLALDLARAEASIPKPETTVDKKEDASTDIEIEPNVGSEIKNEGKGGEVFTPPTPLSEEYRKSLFNTTRA